MAQEALPDVVVRTPATVVRRKGPFVSVVVPLHTAPSSTVADLEALELALSEAFSMHEIVVVLTDGREHQQWATELTTRLPNIQVIGLVRGAGDERAYTAGIDTALGDVVVTARLGSDRPEDVVRCANMVREREAVVYGINTGAGASRGAARKTAGYLMGMDVPSMSLGLRGFSRAALDGWLPRRDRDKVLRVLPLLSGYPYVVMPYEASRREGGAVKLRQALRSVLYASARPLRLAVGLALAASALNAVYALYVLIIAISRDAVEGWTSMSLQMSVMFFLLSLVVAIMAQFMYHANETASERPVYRVAFESTSSVLGARDALNVEAAAEASADATATSAPTAPVARGGAA